MIRNENQIKSSFIRCDAKMGKGEYSEKKTPEKNFFSILMRLPSWLSITFNIEVYYDDQNQVKEIADHGVPLYNPNFYERN